MTISAMDQPIRMHPAANGYEGDGGTTLHLHLPDLRRVIQRLMDATFATPDQDLKVLLAALEHEARLCKQEIERRLGVRN